MCEGVVLKSRIARREMVLKRFFDRDETVEK